MSNKTNLEKLQEWIDNAQKEGLVSINIFPGSDPNISVEEKARILLYVLEHMDEFEDVTDEEI